MVVWTHPNLKNDGLRQLGWLFQPNIYMGKENSWQPNHQPDTISCIRGCTHISPFTIYYPAVDGFLVHPAHSQFQNTKYKIYPPYIYHTIYHISTIHPLYIHHISTVSTGSPRTLLRFVKSPRLRELRRGGGAQTEDAHLDRALHAEDLTLQRKMGRAGNIGRFGVKLVTFGIIWVSYGMIWIDMGISVVMGVAQ